jgi:hypothetical protein
VSGPSALLRYSRSANNPAELHFPFTNLDLSSIHPERIQDGFSGARPNTISRPEGHVFIYMRKGYPPVDIQLDSEVHSVIAWEDIPLGFMKMQVVSPEFVGIKYFRNWPPEENKDLIVAILQKDHYERCKDRLLPLRLQNLSLLSSIYRM